MLDIEETKKLIQYGIIVFSENGKKKSYYKPRMLSVEESEKLSVKGQPKVEYELIALSKDEKAKLGIIEESEQQAPDGEIYIEESEHEPSTEEKLKKAREALEDEKRRKATANNLTLSGDKNAVETAKEILEKEMQKRANEPSKDELLEENEQLKTKLALVAEKELEKKRNAVTEKAKELLKDSERVKEITDQLTSPEGVKAMEFTLNTLEKTLKTGEGEHYSKPAGQAPLQTGYQANTELGKMSFKGQTEKEAQENLARFLKEASQNDPNAKEYYDKLWGKAVELMKSGEKISFIQPQPEGPEQGGEIVDKDFSQLKTDEKSEIRQALDRANELAREKISHEKAYAKALKDKADEAKKQAEKGSD
jgi:hypothetical protein